MAEITAIVAGNGVLPHLLGKAMQASGEGFLVAQAAGTEPPLEESWRRETFHVERLAVFLEHLADLGVGRVVFAGATRRTALDPSLVDPKTATWLPRLVTQFQKGDDSFLRTVIALFEEAGFTVVGAHDVAPDLLAPAGVLTKAQPDDVARGDAARAATLAGLLGQQDVGQGAVVAEGQCLALETLPGTDAMLQFVAQVRAARPDFGPGGGVFYKAPKPNQDRRIDLPAIGPSTVEGCVRAGLRGIVYEPGGVLLLDREKLLHAADAAGMFLWGREA